MDPAKELDYLRFYAELGQHLERTRDVDKALKIGLRLAREAFGAEKVCLARILPGQRRAVPVISLPDGATWSADHLTDFLRKSRPKLPHNLLLGGIERFDRRWGAIALKRRKDYDQADLKNAARAAQALSIHIQRLDRQRVSFVRSKIDRKLIAELRPKDLFYQVLHGLRTLTHYDHSAAVLITEHDTLRLVAEQITWRKGKSRSIGKSFALTAEVRQALERNQVQYFERDKNRWVCSKPDASPLAEALDYNRVSDTGEPTGQKDRKEMSALIAPLATREGGLLGVLKVASCHPLMLGSYEARLVTEFLPHAAAALARLNRTTSLEIGMIEAEKRTVIATLARGVSHDINNAFGSALPLVQQMQVDLNEGRLDPPLLLEDLAHVESSLQVCRRIFGGMLTIARSSARSIGEGNLRRAIETTLSVLAESLRKHDVEVRVSIDEDLPLICTGQGELEQLVLNLAANARDAMPRGGRLEVRASQIDGGVEFVIADTGVGIPKENLSRIREPFFTTKIDGNGLGLSICRSIVWRVRGRLTIDSEPGIGTRVTVFLPARGEQHEAADPDAEEPR